MAHITLSPSIPSVSEDFNFASSARGIRKSSASSESSSSVSVIGQMLRGALRLRARDNFDDVRRTVIPESFQ